MTPDITLCDKESRAQVDTALHWRTDSGVSGGDADLSLLSDNGIVKLKLRMLTKMNLKDKRIL